jgi:signal transduction histidine kinase
MVQPLGILIDFSLWSVVPSLVLGGTSIFFAYKSIKKPFLQQDFEFLPTNTYNFSWSYGEAEFEEKDLFQLLQNFNSQKEILSYIQGLCDKGLAFEKDFYTIHNHKMVFIGTIDVEKAHLVIVPYDNFFSKTEKIQITLQNTQQELTQLKNSLDLLPIPVWIRDKKQNITWVNKNYCDLAGIDDAKKIISEQIELSSTKKAKFLAESASTSRQMQKFKVKAVANSGERLTLEVCELPLEEGNIGVALDCTTADTLQNACDRLEKGQKEVLEGLNTAVAMFSRSEVLQYYNNAFTSLWGIDHSFLDTSPTHGEILDYLRNKRLLPEQRNFLKWKQEQLNLYNQAGTAHDDLWYLPDHRTIRVLYRSHPAGGMIIFFEDVTRQYALERSHKSLENQQYITLNSLGEGVAVFKPDGTLTLANTAFYEFFALNENTIKHIADIVHGIDNNITKAMWEQLAHNLLEQTERKTQTLEMTLESKFISIVTVPLVDGNMLYTFRDITPQKSMEHILTERAEAFAMADKAKEEFVRHISHELRTPLTGIIGFAEALEHKVFGELNNKQQEYAHFIVEASRQLHMILDSLIDLVSIGDEILQLETVRLQDFIQKVFHLSYKKAEKKNIQFKTNIDNNLVEGYFSPSHIKQALLHIMLSTIDQANENSEITLSINQNNNKLQFQLDFEGIAYDDKMVSHIMSEQQQQADLFIKNILNSSIFGLAYAKKVCHLHGGTMHIQQNKIILSEI